MPASLQPGRVAQAIADTGVAVHATALVASLALIYFTGGTLAGTQALIASIAFFLLTLARVTTVMRRSARRPAWIDPLVRALPLVLGGALGASMVYYGAPDSPLIPLAAAAAWESGRRSSSALLLHGLLFTLAYAGGGLTFHYRAGSMESWMIVEAGKSLGLVWLGGLVGLVVAQAPVSAAAERQAHALDRSAASREETREKIARALRHEPLPVESLIAGAHLGLAIRDTELLGFLVMGLTNQEIADALCISEATVKYRLTRLYRRLGVTRRAQAIAFARSVGVAQMPGVEDASHVEASA